MTPLQVISLVVAGGIFSVLWTYVAVRMATRAVVRTIREDRDRNG